MSTLRRRRPMRLPELRLGATKIYSVVIVLATLLLAANLSRKPSFPLVLACMGAVAVYVLLRLPGLAPPLLIVTALLIGYSVGTGTQSTLSLPFFLIPLSIILWTAEHLYQRSLRMLPSRANWPLIAMVLVTMISLIAGNINWIPFAQGAPLRSQLGGAGIFVLSAGAFFVMGHQVRSLRWLKAAVGTFLLLGGIYILGRLTPPALWLKLFASSATGSVFWIWLAAFAFGIALFDSQLGLVWRAGLFALGVATLGVGMTGAAREWSSGWVPALVATGVVFYLRWPRFGTVAAVVFGAAALFAFPAVQAFLLKGNEYSLLTRQAAIEIVLRISEASPLIGLGPANYYFYTPLYPILGWYVNFNSHNQYADIIAQVGFLGMFCVLWFFFAASRMAWTLRRAARTPFARAYANVCLAGVAGTLVAGMLGDWYLPFVYNIGVSGFRASLLGWLFLGGLVAIQHWDQPEAAEASTVPAEPAPAVEAEAPA